MLLSALHVNITLTNDCDVELVNECVKDPMEVTLEGNNKWKVLLIQSRKQSQIRGIKRYLGRELFALVDTL